MFNIEMASKWHVHTREAAAVTGVKKCLRLALLAVALLWCAACSTQVPAANAREGEGTIALIHAALIDGSGGEAVPDGVLLIRDGVIVKAGPYDPADIPDGAEVHDLTGCTMLPGFINAHVHGAYDEKTLRGWLAAGVTTVRDMAPRAAGDFLAARDRLNADPQNARIVSATPIITVPGGYGTAFAKGEEEAASLVKDFIGRGVDIIKFSLEDSCMGSWKAVPQAQAQAIVDAAHAGNRRAAVHITHGRFLEIAVDIGVDDINHMVVEPLKPEMAAQIAGKGILWVPTLELWRHVTERYYTGYDDTAVANLKVFLEAGGKVALGTDYAGFNATFDGGFPITEVEMMADAGMSNMDIIVAGTGNGAIACGLEGKLGTLRAGMAADVLVVRGDPLKDLAALAKTRMVVHGGKIVVDKK